MKKIIKFIIFLIWVFVLFTLISCDKYILSNIYERQYDNEQTALSDVYQQVNKYELDSLPLHDWISNKIGNDSVVIEQYVIRKIIDVKSEYNFIYTKYIHIYVKCVMCPERENYQFVIRYKGKK